LIRIAKSFLGDGHVLVGGKEISAAYEIEGRSGSSGHGYLTNIDPAQLETIWKERGPVMLRMVNGAKLEIKLGTFVSGQPIPVSSVTKLA
jgi:hypothetical protein